MGVLLTAFQSAREKLSAEIRRQEEHNERVRVRLRELEAVFNGDKEWLSAKNIRMTLVETDLVIRQDDTVVASITYHPFIDTFIISSDDIRVDDGTGTLVSQVEGDITRMTDVLAGVLCVREYFRDKPDAAFAMWAEILGKSE